MFFIVMIRYCENDMDELYVLSEMLQQIDTEQETKTKFSGFIEF